QRQGLLAEASTAPSAASSAPSTTGRFCPGISDFLLPRFQGILNSN
ncbi:hypothetical protein A2U01_0061659, partial [Trifolium medium]|nr:hypothetical protein [Trifolium medium]